MSNSDFVARTGDAFKQMAKSVYVLSCTAEGMRHASVASAVCNVSNDPPSLSVCMEKTASFSALLAPGSMFAVNIVGAGQQAVVEHCMRTSGEERFGAGQWTSVCEQPVLSGAAASFICRVSGINDCGSHNIVVAQIEESICNEERSALVYVNGKFIPLPAL